MSLSKINAIEVKISSMRCINRNCLNGSKIINALQFVCIYYRVNYKPNKEVCSRCFRKAVEHYEQLINKWKLGECLLDGVEFPTFDSYVIIDSENDELQPYSSTSRTHSQTEKDVITGVNLALEYFIQLNKTKLEKYTASCNRYLENKLRICKDRSQNIDNLIKSSENNLNLMFNSLYAPYRAEHEVINFVDACDTEFVEINDVQVHLDKNDSNDNNDNQEGSTAEEKNFTVIKNISSVTSTELSKIECLQYPPVKAGQVIYAKNQGPWLECKIRSIIDIDHVKLDFNEIAISTKHTAYFEQSLVQFSVGSRIIAKLSNTCDSSTMDRFYSGVVAEPHEQQNNYRYLIFFDNGVVQYKQHSDIRLIIYKHKQQIEDIDLPLSYQQYLLEYTQKYPAHHILSFEQNNLVQVEFKFQWRYAKVLNIDASMVQVRYLNFNRVEWLYRGSPRIWEIFDILSQDPKYSKQFTYLRNTGLNFFQKNNIDTLNEGEKTLKSYENLIEGKQIFKPAKNSNDEEKTFKTAKNSGKEEKTFKPVKNSNEGEKTIKTTKNSDKEEKTFKPVKNSNEREKQFKPAKNSDKIVQKSIPVHRNVARKRTIIQNNQKKPNKKIKQNRDDTPTTIVPKDTVNSYIKIIPISSTIKPKEWRVHTCSYSCVKWTKYSYNKTKEINKLCIPLNFGFCREIQNPKKKYNCLGKRRSSTIVYVTPCGVIIRSIKGMLNYLISTKSKMKIDQFDFSNLVNPLANFQVIQFKEKLDDLSEGREIKPIICINEINNTLPLPINYITNRQAMPGVNLNGDFLCGCDCTDNCEDRTKCACCQMTINGQKVLPFLASNEYKYGRLSEPIVTGIYECNTTCKCNRNCSNRIVQQPLSQMLQLFLTEKKGWGVRCLNDLPKGSFICIFVGEVLTETVATEEGKQFGDEYLADLDYIEVVEQTKQHYERDVIIPNSKKIKKTCKGKVPNVSLKMKKDMDATSSNSIRQLYGQDDGVYIINAKTSGNIGRYFNHSCSPNTFVQNVFVDTHDLRFPWISIFAKTFIKSGTELTWDYNYQIGSVPGKTMKCFCESKKCRERLL